jgi:cytochrome c551
MCLIGYILEKHEGEPAMKWRWRNAALGFAAAVMIALAACGGGKTADTGAQPSDGKPAGAINAEAVVKQNCISCHGDTLDGKGSPNKNLQKVGARLTKEQIAAQITNGGGGMPALGKVLSAEEINAVAEWLAQKK